MGGYVLNDIDVDGDGDHGVEGCEICLVDPITDSVLQTQMTNVDGCFSFTTPLGSGPFIIEYKDKPGYVPDTAKEIDASLSECSNRFIIRKKVTIRGEVLEDLDD